MSATKCKKAKASLKATSAAALLAEKDDADLIQICARLVGIWHECRLLSDADEWAPDKGPLNPRYAVLCQKDNQLRQRLCGLGIPATREGAAALAQVAFIDTERTNHGVIVARDRCDLLALAVIQSLAETNVPMTTSEERDAELENVA